MGIFGTKRSMYDSAKIRKMRSERKLKKAKVDGITDAEYQHSLGDLIGAGHLTIEGFTKMDGTIEPLHKGSSVKQITTKLEFCSLQQPDRDGVRPQIRGYLSSGHPKDPCFRLKGWFNEDGTIRIELVK